MDCSDAAISKTLVKLLKDFIKDPNVDNVINVVKLGWCVCGLKIDEDDIACSECVWHPVCGCGPRSYNSARHDVTEGMLSLMLLDAVAMVAEYEARRD